MSDKKPEDKKEEAKEAPKEEPKKEQEESKPVAPSGEEPKKEEPKKEEKPTDDKKKDDSAKQEKAKDPPAKETVVEESAKPAEEYPPAKDNTPITEKCHVTIRLKPLGEGRSDQNELGSTNKRFAGGDYEKHTLTFNDVAKKDNAVYKFPSLVAPGDFDNERLYNEMMKSQVERFLDGYNINFFAYGQTGSGKTYTTSGPSGVFKKLPEDAFENYPKAFGLFPRAACDIYKGMLASNKKFVMTICVCEANYQEPRDLVSKRVIKLDPTTSEMHGQNETIINSPEDIFKIGQVIEDERSVSATKMNAGSSRTHALIWIKVYTKTSDKTVNITQMRFVDLAGSERLRRTESGTNKVVDATMREGIMINWSLTVFARVIFAITNLKKPIERGGEIPVKTCWKETAISRMLKSSFNGMAFSTFLFCLSQAEANSGESFSTTLFAEQCAILKTKVTRPKDVKLELKIAEEETEIKNDIAQIAKMNKGTKKNQKYIQFRKDKINAHKFYISVYEQIMAM